MDLSAATEIFDRLYRDVPGYRLSHADRERLEVRDRAAIYGEVAPGGFKDILDATRPAAGESFCDLGSGTGKAVMLAALFHPFARAWGVEQLPSLVTASNEILARYDREVRPALTSWHQRQEIHFVQGDFLQADFPRADVVFAHATCYPESLLFQLAARLEDLRPGARVAVVGHPLQAAHLEETGRLEVVLEWGDAVCHLYSRRERLP
jgi:SAM-dependent methyltransferase